MRIAEDTQKHLTKVEPSAIMSYGIINMAGNAAKWCEDVFFVEEPGTRAIRGGSFYDNAQSIMCFSRNGTKSSERTNSLGFRLCLVSEK
jgi:formylglycine-generating enzyme required for sulfatase activity